MPARLIHCPICDSRAYWREKQQAFVCKNGHATPLAWCTSEPGTPLPGEEGVRG